MASAIERLKEFVGCAHALGRGPREKWAIFWRQTKNLRVRLHMGAFHPQEVFSLETAFGRLFFRDNFGDITNLVDLFYRQVYRTRPLAREGVLLDVGANIGLAAAWLAHAYPGRTIHCFEPLTGNAEMIALNCPAARVDQVALGAARGRIKLRVDRANVMASSIPCDWDTREVELDVVPLDELMAAHAVDRVALIKIDAEGMEVEILRGAAQTLARTDQVVLETHGRERHDATIHLLEEAGFAVERERFGGTTGLLYAVRDAARSGYS